MLSREWRCICSSTDRRCSNYIWVINNFIAYWGAAYIRGLTLNDAITMTLYESQITRDTTVCWTCVHANTGVNTKAPHFWPFANKMTVTYKSVARHDVIRFTSTMTILEHEQKCNVVVKWYISVFSFFDSSWLLLITLVSIASLIMNRSITRLLKWNSMWK